MFFGGFGGASMSGGKEMRPFDLFMYFFLRKMSHKVFKSGRP